jgi:hypothetical protein
MIIAAADFRFIFQIGLFFVFGFVFLLRKIYRTNRYHLDICTGLWTKELKFRDSSSPNGYIYRDVEVERNNL